MDGAPPYLENARHLPLRVALFVQLKKAFIETAELRFVGGLAPTVDGQTAFLVALHPATDGVREIGLGGHRRPAGARLLVLINGAKPRFRRGASRRASLLGRGALGCPG